MQFEEYQRHLAALKQGKRLPTAVYVYREADTDFGRQLNQLLALLATQHGLDDKFNVIKFRTDELKISFLCYPDFLEAAHPALRHAVTIDLVSGRARHTDYAGNHNPPILHRKETFLPATHPRREEFAALTRAEEAEGLYEHPATIGFKLNWERLLREKGLGIRGHWLGGRPACADAPARQGEEDGRSRIEDGEGTEGGSRRSEGGRRDEPRRHGGTEPQKHPGRQEAQKAQTRGDEDGQGDEDGRLKIEDRADGRVRTRGNLPITDPPASISDLRSPISNLRPPSPALLPPTSVFCGLHHIVRSPVFERHKTAMTRYDLSKPVKTLLEYGLLKAGTTFFDYGCGQGSDVRGLQALGHAAEGWDPVHRPEVAKREADVVNLVEN